MKMPPCDARPRKSWPKNVFTITLAFIALLGASEAFLGQGTLLETEGDIFNIYCSDFDRKTQVWHHREITREAVRRVIVKYFKETPPAEGVYNHRDGMTLEEVYSEYYGPRTSSKPFLHTLGTLVDAVASADAGVLGADPRYHFGNERFSESQSNLVGRLKRIIQAGLAGDYDAAIYMTGLSLASIQDFYSNTNWVEVGNKEFNPKIGLPGNDFENVASPSEETCRECPPESDGVSSCKNNLLQEIIDKVKLTSGYSDNAIVNGVRLEKPRGLGKCSHGGSRDRSSGGARGGINKELPTICYSPHSHLHQEAAEQAVQATEFYLERIRAALGDALFTRMFSLHPTPAIVLVLDTTDSMEEELSAITHVVGNLLEKHSRATYPPAEYLLVPFNDPYFSGQVVRSQRPDEIYNALAQLRAVGGGDEPEYSMSALRIALHYAPSFSHVFLVTDASIKDLEVFDSVVALAQTKKIQVTPVLTMPVFNGGILGRSNLPLPVSNFDRLNVRQKRQLTSFGKYLELAYRSGGQVIETPSDLVEETSKIFEAEQYPMALLLREADIRFSTKLQFPVDSLVLDFEVSVSGMVNSAILTSPSGERYELLADLRSGEQVGYTVLVNTPYLTQVRLNMTQKQSDVGEWTLDVDPTGVTSVVIYARTTMDIIPVFYRPDSTSAQPSLQRTTGEPGKGHTTYLDIVITGVDTARLSSINSAVLKDTEGQELLKLDLPVKSPRRNTYIRLPLRDLTSTRFSVVVAGKDGSGNPFRRESGVVWEMSESALDFPLGREVWGQPGDILRIPITISNTNGDSSNTYFIAASDAKGAPVLLSQRRINLGRNETVQLSLEMSLARDAQPSTTSTIVVTATSTRGDTSYAVAHLSVLSVDRPRIRRQLKTQYNDLVPPTITEVSRTSCRNHLTPSTCAYPWSVTLDVQDSYPGLLQITYNPRYTANPILPAGAPSFLATYSATCCNPVLQVDARDLALNTGTKTIDNGNVNDAPLSAGAVSGIVLGSIAALILLILLVVLIVRRLRNSKKENITLRRNRRRGSTE